MKIPDKVLKKKFKKSGKIRSCFHPTKSECKGGKIEAHSIQANGVLSLLEQKVKGNNRIYGFSHLIEDKFSNGFKLIGKKEASIFSGFCNFHDTKIFTPIELNKINIENDEHCFLLAYRGFAKEIHNKYEASKSYNRDKYFETESRKSFQKEMLNGLNIGIKDSEKDKDRLNSILLSKKYTSLIHFSYSLNYVVPIACSSVITPPYSYDNTMLNLSSDPNDVYEQVFVNVFPTVSETHVLFSCFEEDKKSVKYIDDLENLSDEMLEYAITSILIGDVGNTFIGPLVLNRLTKKEKKRLYKELEFTSHNFTFYQKMFFKSKLNLFNKRFEKIIV